MQLYIPLFVAIVTGLITFVMMYVKDIYLKRKSDQIVLIKETLEYCYNPLYLKLLTYKRTDHLKSDELIHNEIAPIVNKYGHLLTVNTLNLYINLYKHGQKIIIYEGEITRLDIIGIKLNDPSQHEREERKKLNDDNSKVIHKALDREEKEFKQSLLNFVDAVTEEYGMYRKQYHDFYNKKAKYSALKGNNLPSLEASK